MKNKSLLSIKPLLSIIVGTILTAASSIVLAALPVNANLTFDDGVVSCISNAGTPPDACSYGTDVVVGSWFAMDTNDNGTVQPGEKIAVSQDRGILLGIIQDATGNHEGAATGTEDTNIDSAWYFFGSTGIHKTPTTGVVINSGDDGASDGIASLDFSDWTMGWGNYSVVSLGGDSVNFPGDSGVATVRCYSTVALRDAGGTPDGSCAEGDYYTLDYTAHVPLGDPSGLDGVGYTLHLVGQQIVVPQVVVSIEVTGGNTQECNTANAAIVEAISNISLDPSDAIFSVSWTLDSQAAGTGSYFNQPVSLGEHQLEVSVTTVNGASGSDTRTVTVEDTQPPLVTAQFLNKFTGLPIYTMQLQNNFIEISAEASDACDPSPSLTDVMYGTLSYPDGYFMAYGFLGGFVIVQAQYDLRVEAEDASGNTAVGNAILSAP